jgi:hypothetical protein
MPRSPKNALTEGGKEAVVKMRRETAIRLIALRLAVTERESQAAAKARDIQYKKPTITEFWKRCGVELKMGSQIEKGGSLIGFHTALMVRRFYGVSLDWIFLGEIERAHLQPEIRSFIIRNENAAKSEFLDREVKKNETPVRAKNTKRRTHKG